MIYVNFFRALCAAGLVISFDVIAAEDFTFDMSSYEKKPYDFGGYVELLADQQWLNPDSSAYILSEELLGNREVINHQSAVIELTGMYNRDSWQGFFRLHAQSEQDSVTEREDETQFYEAILAYKPHPGLTAELGKKALRWGKGYAWNPVGFVERPKNPDEPDLSREGYTMLTMDIINSYQGDLKTIAFTPVYLPVRENVNDDYGSYDHDNIAAKLYFLYKDTDIDFAYLSEGSRSYRYGFDFSRNVTSNFEIHGEWAYLSEVNKKVVDSSGSVSVDTDSAQQWLVGLRYLTENDTTFIIEYYRNEAGYSKAQMKDFFAAVDMAESSSNTALLNNLAILSQQTYLKRNPGQQYLYMRASNKEPYDWLYVTAAVTFIVNLDDRSFSAAPEIIYTGIENTELRLKAAWLSGDENTEYGEKRNERKIEFRLRYYY